MDKAASRIRLHFPSFFKGQICTFANETEVFHKGYFGRSVLDFIFPWFCPVFVPR